MLAHGTADRQLWLWHRRLGHPSFGYLKSLFPSLFLNKSTDMKCETCILAKNHRVSFDQSNTRVKSVFSLIHSDVWGPAPNSDKNRFKYFVLFVDDFSRMTWVYFMKHKSEVPEKFFMFYKMIQTQFKKKLQILRSDNGGEFVNQSMKNFFQENGLIHQTTCPNTPQQNGVVERKNRVLLEKCRAMIIESQTPQYFWPEAIATSVYLLNRLPTQILKHKTPLQTLASQVPIPSVLTLLPRVFGCTVYVHIPKSDRNKLEPCAEKCLFVGYATHQKGYRCYNPVTRRIHVTMDCDFLESEFYFSDQSSIPGERVRESLDWLSALSCSDQSADVVLTEQVDGATESLTTNIERADKPVYTANESTSDDVQQEVNESSDIFSNDSNNINSHDDSPVPEIEPEEPQPRVLPARKNRGVPADRYSPEHVSRSSRYPVNVDRGRVADIAKAFSATLLSENIPKTAQEASKKIEWQEAMNTEVKALIKNGTWEKCVLPAGKKPVGCRWVFTIKYKADGTIERYKARLVAKGYTQTYGIDYSETFSPVAKIDTIRVLFSVAANKDWPLHQFDVKNAFLHGNLEEEVYMEAPPGFSDGFRKNEVCKLKKALYGLKQSPRAWFGRFTMAMKRYGYKQSNADHTLFLKRRGDLVTCLIIYVDDIIITGSDEEEIVLLRKNLFKEFEMKDLGGLKYFLGIEVLRSKEGIFISQRKYILDLLAETGMVD
ncbi:putative RNA-directed DNA polymerase [Helianthus annuus]|nr:putative RNA-directed DNA polymerase [Helianthus annuus]